MQRLARPIQRGGRSWRATGGRGELARRKRPLEAAVHALLFLCGGLSILITLGIAAELGKESLLFFTRQQWEETNRVLATATSATSDTIEVRTEGKNLYVGQVIRIDQEAMRVVEVYGTRLSVERAQQGTGAAPHADNAELLLARRVTVGEFLGGRDWNPQIGQFGIWALVNATLMTSVIALAVALPLGLGAAIYLSEYASAGVRGRLKPGLEVLAGVPTVVYGYFALTMVTPILRAILGSKTVAVYNTASAGIVIGVLLLPLICSMSEDALRAVPRSLREAAYGLGATKLETALQVVVPAALSGISAAIVVGASRAVGETMIVAIAAGAGPKFTFNPFEPAETMTGHIIRISGGDLSYNSLDYNSLFAIGLLLFLMTLGMNVASQAIVRHFREEYE